MVHKFYMGNKGNYIQLVKQAQSGDEESMNRLAEVVREPLCIYVHRLTLDDALTQDILQETLLEMFKFLDKLEKANRFWPWLLRIATNNVNDHYKREGRRRRASMSKMPEKGPKEKQEALENLIGQELKQVVSESMSVLKPQHRAVLTLRCYEELAYSEISEVLGCSTFGARMLFVRAKKSLVKQLSRRGFGKGSLLLALALFGKMSAPSEAAAAGVSVTAATTKVGLAAGLLGVVGGKVLVVSLTTASVLTVGAIVATSGPEKTAAVTRPNKAVELPVAGQAESMSRMSGEYWYFFPEGAGGAVMMQQITQTGRQWLQDEYANYYNQKDNISMRNCRIWHNDLSVWRLPTDGPELTAFLSRVEGRSVEMEYVGDKSIGLLVIASSKEAGERNFWMTRHYNVMDEDYFQSDWPKDTPTIDNRDQMHKRGWTYFKITGRINGKEVRGRGRMPFVYAAGRRHWPWVKLMVGGNVINQACFAGLSRPWMGLHTIDTVRRDAAEKQISFETRYDKSSGKAQVVLKPKNGQIVYTIDMEKDVVESITFSGDTGGQIKFDYLQDIDSIGGEFAEPRRETRLIEKSKGISWLLELVRND
ncbi:MAG: sigma-70 family RNA polymerase sigma factor [Phycisphaerae bacterium]|nr:sigma-70 family RNA polymerase sigma factor [Phycisphaerae bacterium]NIP50441.1 sigma-70 family RNA polymerase sigma factor [Phycisphaerae bacterium]NIS49569.1 sigma-70 family RNA polymerase sigma factor [Phycisphaerae bacterium]NIU07327.1 sigma-70 family RNA polymerase sigma factor [Phycisphaerae bacterium]NIU54896.1 sigma-70 family RNA polymerase sigma factor [Phycisphaerae bacterium]